MGKTNKKTSKVMQTSWLQDNYKAGFDLTCVLCPDAKPFKSVKKMVTHFKQHGLKFGSLKGTQISIALAKEQGQSKAVVSASELVYVDLDPDGSEDFFWCRQCRDGQGKRVSKTNCKTLHFDIYHKEQLGDTDYKNWVVCKDGNALKNGNVANHKLFQDALTAACSKSGVVDSEDDCPDLAEEGEDEEEEGEEEEGEEGEEEEADEGEPCGSTDTPIAMKRPATLDKWVKKGMHPELTGLVSSVQDAVRVVTTALAPKSYTDETSVPTVTLNEKLKELKKDIGVKKRHGCPIPHHDCSLDFKGFKKWLPLNTKVKSPKTIDIVITNLKRFFYLLSWDLPDADAIGILIAVYQNDLMEAIMDLDFMQHNSGWTTEMLNALSHFCTYLQVQCNKCVPRKSECRLKLQQLQEELLNGYKNQNLDSRKIRKAAKKREDSQRLRSFPKVEVVQDAVKKAMLQLYAIVTNYKKNGRISPEEQRSATTAIIGIIFYNGFAGRSGDWEKLELHQVTDMLERALEYLMVTQHKTKDTYGDLAKYLFEGTREACRHFIMLPGHSSGLFLGGASVPYHLQRFAAQYLPKYAPPNSNLIRKLFHTILLRMCNRGECLNLLSKVDAHSPTVAAQVYTTKTEEDDAALSKLLFETTFGQAVAWPDAVELASLCVPSLLSQLTQLDLTVGRRLEDAAQHFKDELEEDLVILLTELEEAGKTCAVDLLPIGYAGYLVAEEDPVGRTLALEDAVPSIADGGDEVTEPMKKKKKWVDQEHWAFFEQQVSQLPMPCPPNRPTNEELRKILIAGVDLGKWGQDDISHDAARSHCKKLCPANAQ